MQTFDMRFGDIYRECADLILAHLALVLATVLAITAGYAALDFLPVKNVPNVAAGLFVSVCGQYHFVEALMRDILPAGMSRRRKYGSVFAAGLLGGIGIFVGFVCLILPGIFLAARWAVSTPFVVAQDMTGREALKASWHATSDARWSIFLVFLAGSAVVAAMFAGLIFAITLLHLSADSQVISITSNFIGSLWLVGGWILSVALYRLLQHSAVGLEDIFA